MTLELSYNKIDIFNLKNKISILILKKINKK